MLYNGQPTLLLLSCLVPFDCHNAGAVLFMVFPPVPGNCSIHNEFSSYGHILISLSASIMNSPLSAEVCNVVEELWEGHMLERTGRGILDSEGGTTCPNQDLRPKIAGLGDLAWLCFVERWGHLRVIRRRHEPWVASIQITFLFIEYNYCTQLCTKHGVIGSN